MDITKKLQEIEEHFNQITDEELEQNLIKAGINEIKSSEDSGMIMVTEEDLPKDISTTVYSPTQKEYSFDTLPNKIYSKIEVA